VRIREWGNFVKWLNGQVVKWDFFCGEIAGRGEVCARAGGGEGWMKIRIMMKIRMGRGMGQGVVGLRGCLRRRARRRVARRSGRVVGSGTDEGVRG
jgi:hypothetical protein